MKAITNALSANSAPRDELIDQLTTRLAYRFRTTHTYSQPSAVATYVISETHTRSAAATWKRRSRTFGAT